jgi:hypothetical protein
MSHKSLTADLCRAARRARGKQGDRTWKGEEAFARFAQFLWNAGYQIHTVGQLREKHFRAWIDDLIARGRTKRTIANNATHIRTALEGIKRRPFADKVSNASLGIAGASRAGTKRPMSPAEFEPHRVKAAATDQGVALVLELELEFGLRAEEGIRSVESLADWLRALTNPLSDGYVTIIHGTKGGKTRRSPPLDREHATDIVRRALEFSRPHRGRLVRKLGMEKAMERYHYVVEKAGMIGESAPHSLRYWYATEYLRRLKASGVTRREAVAAVSTWLGHGDGRGTWVELVYGREELAGAEVTNA